VFPLKDNIPTDRLPVVTIGLIIANVLIYLFFQKGGLSFGDPSSLAYQCNVVEYGAIPREFTDAGTQVAAPECPAPAAPAVLTAFTAMFMHGGLLHLGGNMLFLWIFGNNVEDAMGRARFATFYVLGGLVALAAQIAIDPASTLPTIGASGAVAGVLGGYLLLYPRARVVTLIFIIFFFTIVELPALIILGFWFVQQVLFGYFDLSGPADGGGGVAYFAHIGGFAFGLLAIRLFASRRGRGLARRPLY
jgi:membrane associated rhomboid family serine protease